MRDRQAARTDATSWLVQVLRGLALTTALVIVPYSLIELQDLRVVCDWGLTRYRILKWLTRPSVVFVLISPLVLLAGLLRRWFAPWTRPEKVAVAASVATLLAALTVLLLKVTFGRACPFLIPADATTS